MLGLVNTPNGKRPRSNCASCRSRSRSVTRRSLQSMHSRSTAANCDRSTTTRKAGCRGRMSPVSCCSQAEDGSGPPAGTRVVALTDEFGWAQRVAVPGHRMAALPDNVSFSQAATLPVAGLTALRTLRHGAPLLGKRVLITGAAGGVGTLAVQLAARSGARVTAVVGRPERAAGIKELGATEVVQGIDNAQGRFGLILELAGGASLARAIQLVEAKGTVVVYGNSSGEPTTISFADFRGAQNSRVQSFHYFTSEAEDRFAPDLALLVSLIADGSLKPQIGVERTWRDIAQVAEQLRERRVSGKAVLLVD